MTRGRRFGTTVIAVAVVVASSCSSEGADPPTTPAPPPTEAAAPTDAPTPTEASTPDTGPASSTAGSTTSAQTVVRTDGGSIEVSGDGSVLTVIDVTTADGWEVEVEQPDPKRLEATFTSANGRTDVTIVLTKSGIESSTRSTRTG
jgi:hypothetical protein